MSVETIFLVFFHTIFLLNLILNSTIASIDFPDYYDLVSKEGMPLMKITQGARNGNVEYRAVKIKFSQERDNTILGSTNQNSRFNVTCTAPYLTRWTSNILPIRTAKYGHPQRYNHSPLANVNNDSNYKPIFFSEFSILLDTKSGFIQCESVSNKSLATRVYIYTQIGDQLVQARETLAQIQPDTFTNTNQNFVIPCNANYPNVTAKLSNFVSSKNRDLIEYDDTVRIGNYDPQIGFLIKGRENASERYICNAGKQKLIYDVYNTDSYVGKNETINFYIGRTGTRRFLSSNFTIGVSCGIANSEEKIQIEMINCNSKFECDWFNDCFEINCKVNGVVLKQGIPIGTKTIHDPYTRGKVMCTSEENVFNIAHNYLFTGLDNQLYWLSHYQEVPKSAIIRLSEISDVLYTNQLAKFSCQTINFILVPNIKFAVLFQNGSTLLVDKINATEDPAIVVNYIIGFSLKQIEMNVTVDMVGIMCLAPLLSSMDWMNATRKFLVKYVQAPSITFPSSSGKEMETETNEFIFFKGDKSRNLFCNTSGEPMPKIKWILPDVSQVSKKFENIATDQGTLRFPRIDSSFQGRYNCTATNDYGTSSLMFNVAVQKPKAGAGLTAGEIVAVVGVIFGLVLVVAFLALKYVTAKKKIRNLTLEEVKGFLYGNPEIQADVTWQSDNPVDSIQSMAFSSDFEIPSSALTLHPSKILGEGQFGKVIEGLLENKVVAVKTTKPNAEASYVLALLSELKIMAHVAKDGHPNIVEFLGAVVSEIEQRKVFVVVELSPLGNLENFLRKLKSDDFIDLLNVDRSIEWGGRATQLLSSKISSLNFISWCEQIASGMDFLAKKMVVHSDLASRNILLFENNVVKITDFGLSRKLDKSLQYVKKNMADLPMAWMAIESIRFMKFSTQSDIWSFAVTAWEIFTMGEFPYGSVTASNFVKNLLNGYRLEIPSFASINIYKIMLNCWNEEPNQRPSFSELNSFFHQIMISTTETLEKEATNMSAGNGNAANTIISNVYVKYESDFGRI